MEVSAKHEGQTLTFFLVGELDHHGAKGLLENLEREIERTLPLSLVLDFSGVTFMDSSGIAVALRGWQRQALPPNWAPHWMSWGTSRPPSARR